MKFPDLVAGAPVVKLDVLSPEDAVSLLLEVAGMTGVPPFQQLAYDAAEVCGRLPLVCAVAGGLLRQCGGRIDSGFVAMLREDNAEVLRERLGEFGDKMVGIEDRIILKSLDCCRGDDKATVR